MFKVLSIKQTTRTFLEGESPTLKFANYKKEHSTFCVISGHISGKIGRHFLGKEGTFFHFQGSYFFHATLMVMHETPKI